MAIEWYLTVSALLFAIGAGGVLTKRNPLVILLCLELMLNSANPRWSPSLAPTATRKVRSSR